MQYICFGNQNGYGYHVRVLFIELRDDEMSDDGSQAVS